MRNLLKKYHALTAQGLSNRAMARLLNLPKSTVQGHLRKIRLTGNLGHGNIGRQNRKPNPNKAAIIATAAKYYDFNISHAREMLESRDGIIVNRETLRRWLGRPKKHKRPKQRQRRESKPNFGELLQIDGSFHDWFGGVKTCMINIVDDATRITEIHLDAQETIESACYAAWRWFMAYGVPRAFYADGRNMYHVLEGSKTNFFKAMCHNLGIRVIMARRAQAKGRVERYNGVHQDRLVPLMRLDGVRELSDANKYLEEYIVEHNRRFSHPAKEGNVHTSLPSGIESIDDVCFILIERTLNNDWTFSYEGKTYQIPRQSDYPPAKSKIQVKITISGHITAYYRWTDFIVQ